MDNEGIRYVRRTLLSDDSDLSEGSILTTPVDWLSPFMGNDKYFKIPATHNLNKDPLYQAGKVIGMDAASAASVWALQLEPGMTCLDTCTAPGMKLMLIKEAVGEAGRVIGLDVHEGRLRVCRNLVKKFGHPDIADSLFLLPTAWAIRDGSPGPDGADWMEAIGGQRFEEVVAKSSKKRKVKRHRPTGQCIDVPVLFDRVLVDAECTHDGSQRHLAKHDEADGFWNKHSKGEKNRIFFDEESKIENLIISQKQLIENGFKLLKPGGRMVYSTCSLQHRQNQDVVDHLLRVMEGIALPGILPFKVIGDQTSPDDPVVPATRINAHSCLFDPATSGTSGQFISVIIKSLDSS